MPIRVWCQQKVEALEILLHCLASFPGFMALLLTHNGTPGHV